MGYNQLELLLKNNMAAIILYLNNYGDTLSEEEIGEALDNYNDVKSSLEELQKSVANTIANGLL